ncbi:response regulator transcription factor [Rhodobacteraceae bacterium DSL-40]|uniref:response regulator transcription factor n=1 Tax=Amaricoccus sp. B4 TaxID=3368557 RepID=UPI000DAD9BCF
MTAPAKIFLVDDDVLAQIMVGDIVDQLGHHFSFASDGASARKVLEEKAFDLVILDRRLPDTDGLLLAPMIQAEKKASFIVLSSLDSPNDQVLGLGMGAIDYVCKPVEPVVLSARIKACLAAHRKPEETLLSVGASLQLDTSLRRLSVAGRTETLSPAETRLLVCLIRGVGQPCDRMRISMAICGREWVYGDRTIDVLISRLRRRLRGSSARIITVHGLGYSLIDEE